MTELIGVIPEIETDPDRLRKLANTARRLADGVLNPEARARLLAAAVEFDQRAAETDDATDMSPTWHFE